MSDEQFEAPPPPPIPQPVAPSRPVKLRPASIALFAVGIILVVAGVARIVPGAIVTGAIFAFWGILLFALSFIPLPQVEASEPPLSTLERIIGMFYQPSRVFRSLRAGPRWVAAFLTIAIAGAIYSAAFVQRLTPERIVDFTMEKLEDSPFKPSPEAMAKVRDNALQQARQPVQRVQTAAKSFVGVFVFTCVLGALYLLIVLAFGGRINFWQSFSATLYSLVPIVLIQKALGLVLLFAKEPEDIHPILDQETMVKDNLGVLFSPADHPVLFVLASAIGVLSFYGLWLRATGLRNAGTKVSSSAGWAAAGTMWVLGVLLIALISALFPSFIS